MQLRQFGNSQEVRHSVSDLAKQQVGVKVRPFGQSGGSLSQRVGRGVIWIFAVRAADEGFRLVRVLVLARILAPNDFGLMGIALLAMTITTSLSETGFTVALIQKKQDVKGYLDTAWTISVIRGLILFGVLILGAPLVAAFFQAPAAVSIVRVIGIALLLEGCSNIGRVFFDKELEFNKKFVYQVGGSVADLVVAISAVLILGNVWALVFGLLAGAAVRCTLSYVLHPYRPQPRLDLAKSRELFGYGKWILGSSILLLFLNQTDLMLIGKVLGVTALGLYQVAYRVSLLPATAIRDTVSQVTFPAYSKLQDNLPRLREGYLKTLQITACAAVFLGAGIFALAPEFTSTFLGQNWIAAVPAMQVLALAATVRSISATTGPVFRAVGKPQIITKWQTVRLFLLAALIYPLIVKWGILGASVVVFFSILASAIIFSLMVVKTTQCGIKSFAKMIVPPLIAGTTMVLAILGLKVYLGAGVLEFLLLAGTGILVYLGVIYLLDRVLGYGIQGVVKESLTMVRGKYSG